MHTEENVHSANTFLFLSTLQFNYKVSLNSLCGSSIYKHIYDLNIQSLSTWIFIPVLQKKRRLVDYNWDWLHMPWIFFFNHLHFFFSLSLTILFRHAHNECRWWLFDDWWSGKYLFVILIFIGTFLFPCDKNTKHAMSLNECYDLCIGLF